MKTLKTRQELQEDADMLFASLNWWRKEIAEVIEEADEIEGKEYLPDYEKRMDALTGKMQNLCSRGEFEIEQLDKLEEEINKSVVSRVFSPIKFLKKAKNEE